MIDGWGISCEIALIWMSLDFTDDQSTLVQVMAWCRQATNHYLSQCWPRSLSPQGVTRPQWVDKPFRSSDTTLQHRSGRALAPQMVCYLIPPRHCLIQCWLLLNWAPSQSSGNSFTVRVSAPAQHWDRDKMAAIFQTTDSNGFSWIKMYEFWLKFHWSLFPRVQ